MADNLYNNLHAEGLISDESLQKIRLKEQKPLLFSIHWEIRTLLYAGVLMLTAGLGLLIYENIDTIGHQFVLMLIAAICLGCFYYCFKNKLPFSKEKVSAPNSFFDYILLLASASMLIFVGYLQFEYKVFGTNYGMATFIPMLALFFIAYYFDHIGILSMAMANLAVWMGVSVPPQQLLLNSDFDSETIIYTYLVLGIVLIAAAYASRQFKFKKHFKFSYQHYGIHVAYIALLAGYFHYYSSILAAAWILGIVLLSFPTYTDAFKNKSFYFMLLVVLYSYIALSSLVVRLFLSVGDVGGVYLALLYFIGSGVGLIFVLINLNKKLKAA
ncbi:DUF2157 domain-containing protein [Mucilaginibacter xinganensis]|uniref:DUF2157 domain-containing protein n=1 Tax=Mucilaginibacter xinganensis TaxID=1234841 RepID=A0A223NSB9_9SPHI|nr:DUF2157 domain-containing protein [Mucilaginibacter xinganensis]ASU32584.1 DUF2157 domain-containing protein [Mucilaginibacter xinganensis]